MKKWRRSKKLLRLIHRIVSLVLIVAMLLFDVPQELLVEMGAVGSDVYAAEVRGFELEENGAEQAEENDDTESGSVSEGAESLGGDEDESSEGDDPSEEAAEQKTDENARDDAEENAGEDVEETSTSTETEEEGSEDPESSKEDQNNKDDQNSDNQNVNDSEAGKTGDQEDTASGTDDEANTDVNESGKEKVVEGEFSEGETAEGEAAEETEKEETEKEETEKEPGKEETGEKNTKEETEESAEKEAEEGSVGPGEEEQETGSVTEESEALDNTVPEGGEASGEEIGEVSEEQSNTVDDQEPVAEGLSDEELAALLASEADKDIQLSILGMGAKIRYMAGGVEYTDVDHTVNWYDSENDEYRLTSYDILLTYSRAYSSFPENHENDNLFIGFGSSAVGQILADDAGEYIPIGKSGHPFKGRIRISTLGGASSSNLMIIEGAFFDYIADSAQLVSVSDSSVPAPICVARHKAGTGAPALANHVVHDPNKAEDVVNTWQISIEPYVQDDITYHNSFGGMIGEIGEDAEIILEIRDTTTAETNIVGKGSDIGYVCQKMGKGCSLTINSFSINAVASTHTSYSITTNNGNAGGLVGSMAEGATLTVNASVLNSAATIMAAGSGNYAGGVVGKNDGGTVILGDSFNTGDATYQISNTLNGIAGAGGIFGYYRPKFTTNAETNAFEHAFDYSYYTVNMTANGTGSVGGLFGVLENKSIVNDAEAAGGNISLFSSVNSNKNVRIAHASGDMSEYGGLIGKYLANRLQDSLQIESKEGKTDNSNPNTSMSRAGGSYLFYGGAIGKISGTAGNSSNAAYVKFKSFTANVTGGNDASINANAETGYFGGLVADSANAFVDVENVELYAANNYHGGGVIGKMEDGVLRFIGTTKLSGMVNVSDAYREGQIVGYRDDSLILAEAGWTLTRSSAVSADDIGSWGGVIRFNATSTTENEGILTASVEKFSNNPVLTVNEQTHSIEVAAQTITDASTTISTVADFAKIALCFQIETGSGSGQNPVVSFAGNWGNCSSIKNTNITLGDTISLVGTGITGFTRDNSDGISISASKCIYRGIFNGAGHTLTLAIGDKNASENAGWIYRHRYNGLFGILDGGTINNVTFDGTVKINAKRNGIYAGAAAARAKGAFASDGVNISTEFTYGGGSWLYLGRLLGEASGSITSININQETVSPTTISGDVTGDNSNEASCIGGLIGVISHANNEAVTWNITKVTLRGRIENTVAKEKQQLGGLIGRIAHYEADSSFSHRRLTLSDIVIDGMIISGNVTGKENASMGGLLGYSWYNTDVFFPENSGLIVQSNAQVAVTNNADHGNLAGLVYAATGNWTVSALNIASIQVTSSAAVHSFGMIVNTGWHSESASYKSDSTSSAIYMLLPSSNCFTIGTATFGANFSAEVYDEILAYSAYYRISGNDRIGYVSGDTTDLYVLRNGAGVVSIHSDDTNAPKGLRMDGTNPSCSYTAQTTLGNVANPFTRYYYDLDKIAGVYVTETAATDTSDSAKLMLWGLYQYAHRSIRSYFTLAEGFSASFIPARDDYDLTGYSWYPVDVDNTVTVNGTFVFALKEFEGSEPTVSGFKRTSLFADPTTQHYLIHAGIIRNVSGSLTVSNITLEGTVGAVLASTPYCGALICGKVEGSSANQIATVDCPVSAGNSILLNGIEIYNLSDSSSYAPLLINRCGSYSRMNIANVRTSDVYNYDSDADESFDASKTIATSLIGNVGSSTTKNVNIVFSNMKLDARNTTGVDSELDGIYHTKQSVFSKASLLHSFSYEANSGSTGVYNYTYAEDWTRTGDGDSVPYSYEHVGNVTYGLELYDNSDGNSSSGRNQYFGKEHMYSGATTEYVCPNDGARVTIYPFNDYLPYVYVVYDQENAKYQLEVNHSAAKMMSGCGTYNDPYIITTGDQLVDLANVLSGNYSKASFSILLPLVTDYYTGTSSNGITTVSGIKNSTWCTNKTSHKKFVCTDTTNGIYGTDENEDTVYGGSGDYSITGQELRTYLAGAYYKLGDHIVLTADSGYVGLGTINNANDTFAVFRGVIDGSGYSITNETQLSFITSSYGCVVRNLKVIVNAAITIASPNSNLAFKEIDGFPSYGGVIGQILGGDNILEGVVVSFEDTTITPSGTKSYLIPIGGYVGVILNGGLFFRGMEDMDQKDIQGITSGIVQGDGEPVASTNTKWLYVNPIIGRVLNGYAVTETNAYRPFEDGSRTYPDGSHEYWLETKAGLTITSSVSTDESDKGRAVGVTMRNGTKNYSIADINQNDTANNFTMTKLNDSTQELEVSGDDGATITIKNAQAMFMLSLITQNGLGVSLTGQYSDGPKPKYDTYNILNSYHQYTSTHKAGYTNVGLATIDSSDSDYLLATADTHSGSTDTVPYIIEKYSPQKATDYYPAFNLTSSHKVKVNNKDTEFHYFIMNLDADGATFYLPDGYRGIGAMLFTPTSASQGQVDTSNYYLYLMGFNGNNSRVSLNMNLSSYDNSTPMDNYGQPKGSDSSFSVGFGLLNGTRSKYSKNDGDSKLRNLTISGNVAYRFYDYSTGSVKAEDNVATEGRPSVGGFIGGAGKDDENEYFVENISLNNLSVTGSRFAGGIFGATNTKSYIYVNKCSSDGITVYSGQNAGGIVGCVWGGNGKFSADFDNGRFIIKSVAVWTNGTDKSACNGAGGIIGGARNNYDCKISNVVLEGFEAEGYVGKPGGTNYSGAFVGTVFPDRSPIVSISNCGLENLNVNGSRAGGIVGNFYSTAGAKLTVKTFNMSGNLESAIECTVSNENYGVGGLIGFANSTTTGNIVLENISIEGYVLSSQYNVGGLIGKKTNTNQGISAKNVNICNLTIKNRYNSGGLIGNLDGGSIAGYNVLLNNIEFGNYSNSLTLDKEKCGRIIGVKNTDGGRAVKVAGFSQQGVIDMVTYSSTLLPRSMIGNYADNNSGRFGTGGYVVFADYNGDCLDTETRSETFSSVNNGDNVSIEHDNNPYVTSSSPVLIDATQFLTGDAIEYEDSITYQNSALADIFGDVYNGANNQAMTTSAKRYQTAYTSLSGHNISIVESTEQGDQTVTINGLQYLYRQLVTNGKYSNYQTEMGVQAGTSANFPILVLDDPDKNNSTVLINDYLRLLTNTDFNFAKGTYSDGSTSASSVFRVALGKCTYNPTSGLFDCDFTDGASCLKADGTYIYLDNSFDNAVKNGQFSLIDLQFYDPADSTKVAYHLYVPVLVKKMFRYDFTSSILSGSSYLLDTYEAVRGNTLIENIGNTMTLEVKWTYRQDVDTWKSLVEGGENLLRNYTKKIQVKDETGRDLPTGTRMLLVDANNHNKVYYADPYSNAYVVENGSDYIMLSGFKDSSNEAFAPIRFNDFFNIVMAEKGENNTAQTFDRVAQSDASFCAADGYYYKKNETESGGAYVISEFTFKEGMTGTYKENGSDVIGIAENYYITFFTEADDTQFYHLVFSAPYSFNDSNYPSMFNAREMSHLYTGDIYDNRITVLTTSTANDGREMGTEESEVDTITVTMTAEVSLKANARTELSSLIGMNTVSVYQSFLLTPVQQDADKNQQKGVTAVPTVTWNSFTVDSDDVLSTTSNIYALTNSQYMELRNNVNLGRYLSSGDGVATISASLDLTYDDEGIIAQFPYRASGDEFVGTLFSAASGVSANVIAAANSKNTDSRKTDKLYYRQIPSTASLSYDSDDASNEEGEFYQLGINAFELTDTEEAQHMVGPMKTLATYDISGLGDSAGNAGSMKITLRLSRKVNYSNYLPVYEYLVKNALELRDSADQKIVAGGKVSIDDTSDATILTYIIKEPQTVLDYDTDDKVYQIPIYFTAYTGNNEDFEDSNKYYSNYMVTLEVTLFSDENATNEIANSRDSDHVIYTNAKVHSDVIEVQ